MSTDRETKNKKSRKERPDAETSGVIKVKKRRTKESENRVNTTDTLPDEENIAVVTHKDKDKKRKKRDEDPDGGEKKKRRKDNSAVARPIPTTTDAAASQSAKDDPGTGKKEKKRKKKDKTPTANLDDDDDKLTAQCVSSGEPKQDKSARKRVKKDKSTRRNSHKDKADNRERKERSHKGQSTDIRDLPDPSGDASLSDKSRSALTYARTHLVIPSEWKFNKGLQNWITRHLWSGDDIPSQYFPLVVGYLADAKGGVRDNILKACQTQLTEVTTPSTVDAGSSEATEATQQATNQGIVPSSAVSPLARERAQLLSAALSKASDS